MAIYLESLSGMEHFPLNRVSLSLVRTVPNGKSKLGADFFCSDLKFMSQSVPAGYIPPGNSRGLAQKNCPGRRDLTFESCPGSGNSTRAGILWKFKVKHFVRVLVLLVINIGCPKNCQKMGNTTLLISSSNYAKRHINV